MNDLKVSIIVPIYNVEKYLKKCLDSIKDQTYKNFEVLMINDGSLDGSREICKSYLSDKRFKLIDQKNEGLSGARNTGLDNAKGDCILFVDSDDWIDRNCLEECVKEMDLNKSEVILFPYIKENKTSSIIVKLFSEEKRFTENESNQIVWRRLFGLVGKELKNPLKLENLNTAWGKLYKKNVITKKFIDTKLIGTEDCLFNIYNLKNINKVSYIEKTYYHYRKDNVGALTKNYKENLLEQWKYLYQLIQEVISNNQLTSNYQDGLNNRIILNLFSLVLNITESNLNLKEKRRELDKLLNDSLYQEKFEEFSFRNLPFVWKVFYCLCKNKLVVILLIYVNLGLKLKGVK